MKTRPAPKDPDETVPIRVRCPAKVNLELRVIDRRPDGYHELDTVFQAVSLWDELCVFPADEAFALSCDDPRVPTGEGNLVVRAAAGLREAAGRDGQGARFELCKRIPVGGGLGGGSSDAAGALVGCMRLWGIEPEEIDLQRLAASLGADVPFFLVGGTARGRGRGDRVERLDPIGALPLVLGLPPFGIPTGEVFREASVRLTLPGNGVSFGRFAGLKWPEAKHFGFFCNDLENVVFERWPELRRFRDELREAGAVAALLSGSGSTVYGVARQTSDAERMSHLLARRFPDWKVLEARAVDSAAHVVGRMGRAEGGPVREG